MSAPTNSEELVEQLTKQLRDWLMNPQGTTKFTVEREVIPTPGGEVVVLTAKLEGILAQAHVKVPNSGIVVPTAVPPPGIVKP